MSLRLSVSTPSESPKLYSKWVANEDDAEDREEIEEIEEIEETKEIEEIKDIKDISEDVSTSD